MLDDSGTLFRFKDNEIIPFCVLKEDYGEKWIRSMAYFSPFFDGDFSVDAEQDVIPVPCARDSFLRALELASTGRLLSHDVLTPEMYKDALHAADKLGMDMRVFEHMTNDVKFGRSHVDLCTCEMNRGWWRGVRDLRLTRFTRVTRNRSHINEDPFAEKEERGTVNVDEKLARDVTFLTDAKNDAFLFSTSSRGKCQSICLKPGDAVLKPDPVNSLMNLCDARVLNALEAFPEQVCLAGGSVLSAVAREYAVVEPGSDYDLFVTVNDDAEADRVLDGILERLGKKNPEDRVITKCAVTVIVPAISSPVPASATATATDTAAAEVKAEETKEERHDTDSESEIELEDLGKKKDAEGALSIQVILRRYPDIHTVIRTFDIGPSQVGATFLRKDGKLVVRATPMWVECMRAMAFPVNLDRWSRSTPLRVLKYVGKGFRVAVPGVCRSKVGDTLKRMYPDIYNPYYSYSTCGMYLLYEPRYKKNMSHISSLFLYEEMFYREYGSDTPLPSDDMVKKLLPDLMTVELIMRNTGDYDYDTLESYLHPSNIIFLVAKALSKGCGWLRRIIDIKSSFPTVTAATRANADADPSAVTPRSKWNWRVYDPSGINSFFPADPVWEDVVVKE